MNISAPFIKRPVGTMLLTLALLMEMSWVSLMSPAPCQISFGAFGKVSIGDNKAVTSVVQSVIGQIVKRLTVEGTYRVLTEVPVSTSASQYELTGYFMSPNQQTPQHYTWVQYF